MDMHIGSINVSIRSLALSFHLQSFAILASKCQAELIWGCKTVPRSLSVGCILFSPGPPTSKLHPVCNNFPDIFLQHPQKTNITRRSLYYSVTCPWSLSPESFWHFTLSWCDMHWSAAPSLSYLNRHEYFHCTPHLKLPHFYENLRCLQGNFPLSSCQVARHKTVITKWVLPKKKNLCSRHTVLRFPILHLCVLMVWNYHHNSCHYFVSVNACLAWSVNIQGRPPGIMNVVRRAIHFGNSGQPREWMVRW